MSARVDRDWRDDAYEADFALDRGEAPYGLCECGGRIVPDPASITLLCLVCRRQHGQARS